MAKYYVKEKNELLQYLIELLKGKSRTSIKSLLSNKLIKVNQKIVTQFNLLLLPEDVVEILSEREVSAICGIKIVFEDEDLLAIEKKSGMLSVPAPDGTKNNVYNILSDYVQQKNRTNKVYIVHRLDQFTSGVMIFVKTEKLQLALRSAWDEQVEERIYVAVIEGTPIKKKDTLISWLKENKSYHMYASQDKANSKKAVTHYKILQSNSVYSLAEIWLETGRKNQIRVHFQDMGYPVAGDRKYGAETDPCKRLMLHAKTLQLTHPFTKKTYHFESAVPNIFFKCLHNNSFTHTK